MHYMLLNNDEVKPAVAPCGSSEKSFQNYHMVLPQASPHHLKTPWKATEIILLNNIKGTHRPKTHNEKYIGETYDEH